MPWCSHLNDPPVVGDELLGRNTEGGVAHHGLNAPDKQSLLNTASSVLFFIHVCKVRTRFIDWLSDKLLHTPWLLFSVSCQLPVKPGEDKNSAGTLRPWKQNIGRVISYIMSTSHLSSCRAWTPPSARLASEFWCRRSNLSGKWGQRRHRRGQWGNGWGTWRRPH